MSSLEDLVTSTLSVEESEEAESFQTLSPIEIYDKGLRVSSEAITGLCESIRAVAEESPQRVPLLIAQIAAYSRGGALGEHFRSSMRAMMLAASYGDSPSEELLGQIEEWAEQISAMSRKRDYERQESALLGGSTGQIDFLREFFGEGLEEELSCLIGVKNATVKRWVQGADMRWENGLKLRLLARTFYALRHRQNLSDAEALLWYRTPQSGKSPREMFESYSWAVGSDLRAVLDEIGATSD